mmetsp:Transcript_6797/g.12670  ORF Transcript_6797/g.12670 Transcript_6797/m.12670 type:complete len:230 (-) Transcript_6797:53-742(-)
MASIRNVLAFFTLAILSTWLQGCFWEKDWCAGLDGLRATACKTCVEEADKKDAALKDTAKGLCKDVSAAAKLPVMIEKAAQVQKRPSQLTADSVTHVSSVATPQHNGAAMQPQKSAFIVASHGNARARRKFQEHMELMEEREKAVATNEEAMLEEATQGRKRASEPAADAVTGVSSHAMSQHNGPATQPQKPALAVRFHHGARARQKLQEHMKATEGQEKDATVANVGK